MVVVALVEKKGATAKEWKGKSGGEEQEQEGEGEE
jgi:hypothetical protein